MESPWIESPKRIFESTPPKMNIEPENDGPWNMIFLDSRGPVFSGSNVNLLGCFKEIRS